ncbi:unnamed protein product [Staurois parvus]|uniref:Uncharacterized protein n=1 Tax=Staurois parvus TaxID=386267 RepID=A0ABN9D9N1_9NEOB|nr:unnamed protein product [Staurois parvus]
MYINGRTRAVQERVAVHKRRPHLQPVCASWECAVPAVSGGHSRATIAVWDLCVRS